MKKIILILLIIILILISGCNQSINSDSPQTLEELKYKKLNNPSEYDKCLKEIETNEKAQEQCIRDKLKERGYEDDVNCIQNFTNPICDFDSYSCVNNKMEGLGYDGQKVFECGLYLLEADPICDKINKEKIDIEKECNKLSDEKTQRYNAEVSASNECFELFKGSLTFIDCIELMGKG